MENIIVIKKNPSEETINKDLEKAQEILVLHLPKDNYIMNRLEDNIKNYQDLGYLIQYIHYYTEDNTFTIGITKMRD